MSAALLSEKSLTSTMAKLQESGAYSDFQIVCGSDTYHVHKAIICPQSEFFRAACRPHTFREGETNVIKISAGPGRDIAFYSQPLDESDFDWDLDVETTATVKLMVCYLYRHDYLEEETTEALKKKLTLCGTSNRKGLLAEHARMYAMGEKYGISGLKALAVAKFKNLFIHCHDGLAAALIIAFKGTPDTDRELRELVFMKLHPYRKAYKENAEVQAVISRVPDLCYGLYRKLSAEY
ncbi:hypothetical protein VTO58DRAFT_104176 [Aureobasidium pullulans]|nr:hypothetical protein JADG_001004 [Aureobasidium pullulans]